MNRTKAIGMLVSVMTAGVVAAAGLGIMVRVFALAAGL